MNWTVLDGTGINNLPKTPHYYATGILFPNRKVEIEYRLKTQTGDLAESLGTKKEMSMVYNVYKSAKDHSTCALTPRMRN